MDDLVKILTDNGISVVCVAFMIYYILVSQKENNRVLQEIEKTLTAICTLLGIKEDDIEKVKKDR